MYTHTSALTHVYAVKATAGITAGSVILTTVE